MRSLSLDPAPTTCLIQKCGTLKRDPGMFSAWTDCSVILTKDNFFHVYPWKDSNIGNTEQTQNSWSMVMDLSQPLYTVNLNNVKSIQLQKDCKLEIQQSKTSKVSKSKRELKDLGVSSTIISELTQGTKYPEKVILKGLNDAIA